MGERFRDFCINETARLNRMAAALAEAGHDDTAEELRALAKLLDALREDAAA